MGPATENRGHPAVCGVTGTGTADQGISPAGRIAHIEPSFERSEPSMTAPSAATPGRGTTKRRRLTAVPDDPTRKAEPMTTAAVTTEPPAAETPAEKHSRLSEAEFAALDARLREFATSTSTADRTRDRTALERSADLAQVQISGNWIDTYVEPQKKVGQGGRDVDPFSDNQFAGWAAERYGVVPGTIRTMLRSHRWATKYCTAQTVLPSGLRAIDAFRAVRSAGYEASTPEIVARAVELADGAPFEPQHVRAAWHEFRDKLTPVDRKGRARTLKSERLRQHAMADLRQLSDMGKFSDVTRVLKEAQEYARTKRAELLKVAGK